MMLLTDVLVNFGVSILLLHCHREPSSWFYETAIHGKCRRAQEDDKEDDG